MSTQNANKISVIITAYNHEPYIGQCLDSVLRQKGDFTLEVVLGDDCSSDGTRHIMEFSVKLDSNPEFTSSVLLAYARALHRLVQHGGKGAYSVFDIPFGWLSPKSPAELRKMML